MLNSNLVNFPKISIVTPSFNQGEFIEQTIQSVLEQDYPNLEYLIIDGGSTDQSVEIIKKYEEYLAFWVSEKDEGHYHAINKGFAKCTGEIMAWLNSDDMYTPWALKTVASAFMQFPQINWVTTLNQLIFDDCGLCADVKKIPGYSRSAFLDGRYTSTKSSNFGFIQQESTFWRRSLWEAVDGLRCRFRLAADYDLWGRFFQNDNLWGLSSPLAGFRFHQKNKSHNFDAYMYEVELVHAELGRSCFSRRLNRVPLSSYFASNLVRTISAGHGGWRIENVRFR